MLFFFPRLRSPSGHASLLCNMTLRYTKHTRAGDGVPVPAELGAARQRTRGRGSPQPPPVGRLRRPGKPRAV